ncbi:MAG: insulinase family protein [Chitinispirillales bacterium]|jgi:zinc protease|nr:insulinase family protein [Chitinispirillales bacterium]
MSFRYQFPPKEESVLPNGLRLILLPDHTQEGVVAALQMPFGRFSDPVGLEGIAELTMGVAQKGTQSLSSELFTEKIEFLGASVSANTGEEHTVFELRAMSVFFHELMPLFWEMIFKPALDKREFDIYKKETITALTVDASNPVMLANRHFYRELAGSAHPVGRFQTAKSLKSISIDNLLDFHRQFFSVADALLIVAGNFDTAEFKERYMQLLFSAPSAKSASVVQAQPIEQFESGFRIVDKPDSTQATIFLGHPLPGEDCGEHDAITLANYILGGGNFSSRLMKSVRSRHGQTYDISSYLVAERRFGAFRIATSTQNRSAAEVYTSILDEYKRFCEDGVTNEELEKAKKFVIGNIAFQLEGINSVVEKLLWLRFFGYEDSYIEQFDKRMELLTPDVVNDAIRRYFSSSKLVTVIVGRKLDIFDQFKDRAAGIKLFNYRDPVK